VTPLVFAIQMVLKQLAQVEAQETEGRRRKKARIATTDKIGAQLRGGLEGGKDGRCRRKGDALNWGKGGGGGSNRGSLKTSKCQARAILIGGLRETSRSCGGACSNERDNKQNERR